MPNYIVVAAKGSGTTPGTGNIRWTGIAGVIQYFSTEAYTYSTVRETYTLSNAYVYVSANAASGTSTLISRVNAGNGNISISIGAGQTGSFEDTSNSDNITNGLTINWQLTNGAGGDVTTTLIMAKLSTASNTTPLMTTYSGLTKNAGDAAVYGAISGANWWWVTTEAEVKYKVEDAVTFSNLSITISANTVTATSTLRLRVDGANGNSSVSVGSGQTGVFTNAAQTDVVSSSSDVNYSWTVGGTGTSISLTTVFMKSNSDSCFIAASGSFYDVLADGVDTGDTLYFGLCGSTYPGAMTTTEARVQAPVRSTLYANNMLVVIADNTLDGATTFRTRIDGANGNLVVSVGAGQTGQFEDTTHSDSYTAAEKINYQVVAAGSSGLIVPEIVGISILQSSPATPVATGANILVIVMGEI